MAWLRMAMAALLLAGGLSAAAAQEWRVAAATDPMRTFAAGQWTTLATGDAPRAAALLRAGDGGRLRLERGESVLDFEGPGEMRAESDALVRLFSGSAGVVERAAPGPSLVVMTPEASFDARSAEFGLTVDASQTTLYVKRGVVVATDVMSRHSVEVREGQTYRALFGRPGAAPTPIKPDAAAIAAREAAERAGTGAGASPSAGASSPVDRTATGALAAGKEKADPKLAEDAADAAHQQRAKLGKADPRAAAAAQSIERDLTQGFDVETEPFADDFRWTENDNGEMRLKPLWRVVLGLEGAERYEFWTLFLLLCLLLGGATNAIMKETGFGAALNAVMVMVAFVVAVLVRDLFFRAATNLPLEPFLTLGMMLGAAPALLLGGAFAKMRA